MLSSLVFIAWPSFLQATAILGQCTEWLVEALGPPSIYPFFHHHKSPLIARFPVKAMSEVKVAQMGVALGSVIEP